MSQQASGTGAPLEVSVQILSFEPGLYRMSFTSRRDAPDYPNAAFPWAKLEAPPGTRPGHSVIVIQGENGWLARTGDTAIVQVVGELAPLLLTIYQIAGVSAPPEFMVQRIDGQTAAALRDESPAAVAPAAPGTIVSAAPAPPATPARPQIATTNAGPIEGLAHVRGRDVSIGADGWIGVPGGGEQLEGFALTLAGRPDLTIEYSATLGPDWSTPWVRDGEFCGSRGLALPLLGLAARLVGPGAEELDLHCLARYVGGQTIGPTSADDLRAAPNGAALEAFRFTIAPANRKTGTAPPPAVRTKLAATSPRGRKTPQQLSRGDKSARGGKSG
jgi:hypothetical protein